MKKPVMGIQLYTLRDFCQTAEDFSSTLRKLAEMGVKDVQISAIGNIPAEKQKEALDSAGIKVCVTHKSFDRMLNGLNELIIEHKTIGCDALGLGSAPSESRGTTDRVRDFIKKAEQIGRVLKESEMTFNYHNHDFEFKPLEDSRKTMMDLLINETDPQLFNFIPDVAWIHYAGFDPVDILEKMKGRVKVLHFKDYIIDKDGNRKFVSLGQGKVDLKACYEAAVKLEIPYIMYEQDCDWVNGDAFEATIQSWDYMKGLSGD